MSAPTAPTTTIPSNFLSHPDHLGVVAVGFSGGQCKPGTEAAPTALLSSGLLTQLSSDLGYTLHHDNTVHTYSSLLPASDPSHRGMKNPLSVSRVTEALSKQVYEHAKEGRMVLTLGGDHSIAIGTVSGVARGVKERCVRLWFLHLSTWAGVTHKDIHRHRDTERESDRKRIMFQLVKEVTR